MEGLAPLLAAAGSAGTGVVALTLLVIYIRHTSADRKAYVAAVHADRESYAAALRAAETRHAAELTRLIESRDREITELRVRLDAMDARITELTRELDEERRRRWRAEDAAAEARR